MTVDKITHTHTHTAFKHTDRTYTFQTITKLSIRMSDVYLCMFIVYTQKNQYDILYAVTNKNWIYMIIDQSCNFIILRVKLYGCYKNQLVSIILFIH